MHRRWPILAALLVAALATAGCAKEEDMPPGDDGTTTTTTPPTGGATTTTPPTNGTGGGATPPPAQKPVEDAGTINGPFDKSWTIPVPQVSPKVVTVLFNLTGAQAGAPATARVHLDFVSPDGTVLKSAVVGLGESPSVAWAFQPADIPTAGDYVVKASAAPSPGGAPGLPSGGVANYQLYALVEY